MTATEHQSTLSNHLIELETAALRRWCNGDPSGFLELSAGDVVYFDPFQPHRIDGLPALTAFYETLRGKIYAREFNLIDPRVQPLGNDGAVLTYNFLSESRDGVWHRWNCTEGFRRDGEDWKILQTHWSFTNAGNG